MEEGRRGLELPLSLPLSRLLSEDDLAAGANVLAGLGGALVLASLETDHSLAGRNRLLIECPHVRLGGLGAEPRAGPLGVHVGLWKESTRVERLESAASAVRRPFEAIRVD